MKIYCHFLFVWLVLSCHERNQNDSKAVKEELRQREIVHVTQAQISERGFEMGDTLTKMAEQIWLEELKNSKDSSCTPAFQKMANKIFAQHEAEISRYKFDPSALNSMNSKKEKEVLDAILFNRESHLPISPNLQKDGEKDLIFSKALVLSNQNCVSCHQKNKLPILTGKLGDTLGVYVARFGRKKVIMSFVD